MGHGRLITFVTWGVLSILNTGIAIPSVGASKVSDRTGYPRLLFLIFIKEYTAVFCSEFTPVDLIIEHHRNYSLDCDPEPATPAGIRYLLLTEEVPARQI